MADRESSEPLAVDKTATNNPLSRKLNKILETRLENDKDTLEALKGLSTFFTENSLRTRRNLRSDIERQSLAINEEFASAFGEIKMQLDSVYEDVKGMSKCCEEMTNRLKTAKAQTHDLIDKTTGLQAESQRLQIRSQVVDAFLSTFQLKPEESKLLRVGRDNNLNPGFFTALARVKQIHNDCKLLLRTNQQTAGLDIMESMALHQEAAYERLYRWTQGECRVLNSDLPDISSLLCQAMESLQDRPVLFKYSLDEFATARRTAIVKGFINALTRGGPGGTPRPIELHSHDPLRYVGDMLAWLHQNTASEKEHLETLLRKCSNKTLEEHSSNVLAHITEGLCRPFKVRVEQVIIAEPGPVMLYKLTNLLKFYHNTISQMLSSDALLLTTVEETHVLSLKMFFTSLNRYAAKMLESVELPPSDLGPTTSLNQTLTLLKDILTSHDSSLVSLDDKQQDFAQILSCVVDPLIQFCSVSASKLNTLDMATYMVNCIYSISSTLALYEFTDQRLEMLQAQIEAHLDTLVSEQASYILNSSGMAYMYNVIQQHQPKQGPLSSVVGMDGGSIKAAMSKFDSYLAAPDSLIIPQCSLLLSATLRETLKKRSVELIHIAYNQMYQAVMDPANAYQAVASLMPRTPDQISSLLL